MNSALATAALLQQATGSDLPAPDNLRKLVELAFQYGPFLFALLFTLYIARWTYGNYRDVCARTNPRAEKAEIKTCQWMFVFTSLFGVMLVVVSVVWWFFYRPALYIFQGQITRLREYEKIACKDFYFRARSLMKPGENVPELRDEEFIAIQTVPFPENKRFEILFSKSGGEPEVFPVAFSKAISPQFHFEWDEGSGRNRLVELGSAPSTTGPSTTTYIFPLERVAFAQEKAPGMSIAKKPANVPSTAIASDSKIARYIALLQEERTDVGTKIMAIDALGTLDVLQLKEAIRTDTGKEPFILTLNDLTRHNDRELASKARSLLRRLDLTESLAREITSNDPRQSAAAESTLRRLDRTQALAVLQATGEKKSSSVKELERKLVAEQGSGPLVPTGSAQGDRYYVKARWQPEQPATVACLTKLFNTELNDRPSMEKESAFMKGRSERLVYWYSKEWAISMAEKIKKCGGQATFVSVP